MRYEDIIREVNKILDQYDMPLTLRQLFYRLVAQLIIPNTITSYKTLSKWMVKAREQGDVDDRRIEDRSRQVLGVGDWGYEDVESFLNDRIKSLQESWQYWARSLWETQPLQVLVALEKDALSRLFTDVTDRFHIHVFPTRGYGSYAYVKDMAERIVSEGKPAIVLYFGDFDPSGRDIERDLRERLERYGAEDFKVVRVALTKHQIAEHNLPPRPEDAATLEKLGRDPRRVRYGLEYACELDALEPPTLQDMIQQSVMERIDEKEWNTRVQQIKDEQTKLKEKLTKLKISWEE